MSLSFNPRAAEKDLRNAIVKQHDEGPEEVLVALCALWAQATTLERMDYLIDRNGDGFDMNFKEALEKCKKNVDGLGRRISQAIDKEECYAALRPVIRFATSFVSPALLDEDNKGNFMLHPSSNYAPTAKSISLLCPLIAYAWKRRDDLRGIKWEGGASGVPASEEHVERARVMCLAKVDMVASDIFMDRVRNYSLALQMPTWTLSMPSTREFQVTGDYYQAMRESSPMELNMAYRLSSVPPLLVFKEGGAETPQREAMMMLMLCGKKIDVLDERLGHNIRLPVRQDTLVFAGGQYSCATPETKEFPKGYGAGETGMLGALLQILGRSDAKSAMYIKGETNSFREKSEELDFNDTQCW